MTRSDELDENYQDRIDLIAEHLEALSKIETTPTEIQRHWTPKNAPTIRNGEGATWLEVVVNEQGWLRLPDKITSDLFRDAPRSAAVRIFELLGERGRDAAACLAESNGSMGPTLSIKGATLLEGWLETACNHAETFARELEETNKKIATENWIEAWNDSPSDSDQLSPIEAETKTTTIPEIKSWADKCKLILNPSYQRDDVWPLKASQQLIESILQTIPLPSIVLLKMPAYRDKVSTFDVVDGKQRLTAILRFIGAHPKAREKLKELDAAFPKDDFKNAFDNDYPKFRKLWKKNFPSEPLNANRERQFMLPFRLRTGSKLKRMERLRECEGKYFTQIRDIQVSREGTTVSDIFVTGSEYKIALITFSGSSPRQIHEVFKLYNRQGMKLNAEEMRNAVYHELHLTRALLAASEAGAEIERMMPSASSTLKANLQSIFKTLVDESVPRGRYTKFKLLGWTLASAFALEVNAGQLRVRSTADHIDTMLDRCAPVDSGASTTTPASLACLTRFEELDCLFSSLAKATDLMMGVPMWDDKFKNGGDGNNWQDLQFVAALTAMLLGAVTLGDKFEAQVVARSKQVHLQTATLMRPEKSQNRSQWAFIGHAVNNILASLEISAESVSTAFTEKFKCDPMVGLNAATAIWEAEHQP